MGSLAAKPERVLETERVIITRWTFAPGATTGFHTHQHDYVVVPLVTGKLGYVGADGQQGSADLTVGQPYSRKSGVAHDVNNPNPFEFSFIEIELK